MFPDKKEIVTYSYKYQKKRRITCEANLRGPERR